MNIRKVINTVFSSNTFIVEVAFKEWILIDCGDVKNIITDAHNQKAAILGVFLTHVHFDHIYGLNELLEAFPKLIVFLSENGRDALYSDRLNYSKYHGTPYVYNGNRLLFLRNKQVPIIGGTKIEVLDTPGHTQDSLSYVIGDYVFSGDAYIPGVNVVTSLRGGNKEQAENSVSRIKKILQPGMTLCPGHGDCVRI